MEYKEFAKYYDIFYQNKNYQKETEFLKHFITKEDKIIDIGCGTGIHGRFLEKDGYQIDGLDLNKEMLDCAKERIHGNLYQQDMLKLNISKKYDIIISMFAVINHLKDTESLKIVLNNFKNILLPYGKIIIDLHNPNGSGTKIDSYHNLKRTMTWNYNAQNGIEKSNITYEIDNNIYHTEHTFKIFTIDEMLTIATYLDLELIDIYYNYSLIKQDDKPPKNIQFVLTKKK